MSKVNRDNEFKALGGTKAGYRKSSIRNQSLHPQYVKDYEQTTGRTLTAADKGVGNGIYQTHFGVLYTVVRDTFGDVPLTTGFRNRHED